MTANNDHFDAGGHYYGWTRCGQLIPVYELPNKTDPNKTHQPTIRDARIVNERGHHLRVDDLVVVHLLPSVTTILGVMNRDGLNNWKVSKMLEAAALTPYAGGGIDAWQEEIRESAMAEVGVAADLGTAIHDGLEAAFAKKSREAVPEAVRKYVYPVLDWEDSIDMEITFSELPVCNLKQGYAGKTDKLFSWGKNGVGILDYKSRKSTRGRDGQVRFASYETEPLQLAAYAAAHYGEDYVKAGLVLAANVMISTSHPGDIDVVKYDNLDEHYQAFLNVCALWRYMKKHDPRI